MRTLESRVYSRLVFSSGLRVTSLSMLSTSLFVPFLFWLNEGSLSAMYALQTQPLVTVSGAVLQSENTHSSENEEDIYRVRYQFRTHDGQNIRGASFTNRGAVAPNTPVQVEYVATQPTVSRIQGMRDSLQGGTFLLAFLFLLPGNWLVLFWMLFSIRRGARQARVLREGRCVSGMIVRKEETNSSIDDEPVLRYWVQYNTPHGAFHAPVETHLPKELQRSRVGKSTRQ